MDYEEQMEFAEQIKKMSLQDVLEFTYHLPGIKGYRETGMTIWQWHFIDPQGNVIQFRENIFDWEARYQPFDSDDWYHWPNQVRMTKAELYSTESYKNIKRTYDV